MKTGVGKREQWTEEVDSRPKDRRGGQLGPRMPLVPSRQKALRDRGGEVTLGLTTAGPKPGSLVRQEGGFEVLVGVGGIPG